MHRIHGGFTMTAVIKCGESPELKQLLKKLNIEPNPMTDFNDTPSLLFISGVILPQQTYLSGTIDEIELPERLVLATSYCGPLTNHLEELVKKNREGLIEIFSHCNDFNNEHAVDDKSLIFYLKQHKLHSAFNSRYSCITKEDVRLEKELRNEIECYIDKANQFRAFELLSSEQIRKLIQRHIITRGDKYKWTHKPAQKNVREFFATNPVIVLWLIFLLFIAFSLLFQFNWSEYFWKVLFTFFGIVILVVLLIWYISRPKNKTADRPPDQHVRETAATQLRPVLNEMTAVGPLKAGTLRKYFYAAALRVIGLFAPSLMQVPTVSSIRWLVTDNKRRLLFLSNFSNTTDFYVRDFLNGSTPRGVNFMFTNGVGFPDAKYLVKDGIKTEPEGFMDAVHTGQQVTDLWYAHEKNLTVDIINKNRKIRNGLFAKMNEEEIRKWLNLL